VLRCAVRTAPEEAAAAPTPTPVTTKRTKTNTTAATTTDTAATSSSAGDGEGQGASAGAGAGARCPGAARTIVVLSIQFVWQSLLALIWAACALFICPLLRRPCMFDAERMPIPNEDWPVVQDPAHVYPYLVQALTFFSHIYVMVSIISELSGLFARAVLRIPTVRTFRAPLAADNIRDFWRRWNCNASLLFQYAVYQPLMTYAHTGLCYRRRPIARVPPPPSQRASPLTAEEFRRQRLAPQHRALGRVSPVYTGLVVLLTCAFSGVCHEVLLLVVHTPWPEHPPISAMPFTDFGQFLFFTGCGVAILCEAVVMHLWQQHVRPWIEPRAPRCMVAVARWIGPAVQWIFTLTLIFAMAMRWFLPGYIRNLSVATGNVHVVDILIAAKRMLGLRLFGM
jgi:hypothetical protein